MTESFSARFRASGLKWPVLLLLLFAVFQTVGHGQWQISNDSYRYARSTMQMLGEPRAEAQEKALRAFCASEAYRDNQETQAGSDTFQNPGRPSVEYHGCVNQAHKDGGLVPNLPRYDQIFDTRPGYPMLLVPLVGVFGILHGMWLTSLLLTLLAAALVYRIAREARLSQVASTAAMAVYLLSPLTDPTDGSMAALTEAPVFAATLAAVLGGMWLIRGRLASGTALLLGSLVVMGLVKYSSVMMLAGCFAAVGLLLALTVRELRGRGLYLFVGLSAVSAVASSVITSAMNLPSMNATLQDTFTHHYERPDVANPTSMLVQLDQAYWKHWLVQQTHTPYYLPLLILTVVLFWRLRRQAPVLILLMGAVWVIGMAGAVVHPQIDQNFRLWLPAWIPVAFGMGLGLDLLLRRRTGSARRAVPADGQDPLDGIDTDGPGARGQAPASAH